MPDLPPARPLSGRNILVAGGTRGLGLAIARALGEQGAGVHVCGRTAGDVEAACAHLALRGVPVRGRTADVTAAEDLVA
ncbi:hypothetical protein B7486_54235, partial [cyanobacterium TDX16]